MRNPEGLPALSTPTDLTIAWPAACNFDSEALVTLVLRVRGCQRALEAEHEVVPAGQVTDAATISGL